MQDTGPDLAPARQRRRFLTRGAQTILLLTAPMLARGATVLAVRVWPAADYTRLTIESDAVLKARHTLFDGASPRLSIDIDGLTLDAQLRDLVGKVKADDPFIAGVRVGQFNANTVRVVLDLKQGVKPQQLQLAPVAAYQHRLVFDLYPLPDQDPLIALINEREASQREAIRSMADALGEFIGRIGKDGKPVPGEGDKSPRVADSTSGPRLGNSKGAKDPKDDTPPAATARAGKGGRVERLTIVALDPGHGGEDPGAVGPSGLREKDVVLQIGLALRDRLQQMPNMRVLMTRDDDYYVALHERVRKARRVQADLFVSIHADAFIKPEARGASVFALSNRGASSASARWLANKENAADAIGGINIAARDRHVMAAVLDMSTSAQIRDSLTLGSEMITTIGQVGKLHSGRVEQAGFAVLKAPDIPSVLVETAFISNPEEEQRLRDPAYQARLVEALATGIQRYFRKRPSLMQRPTA